MKNGTYEYKQGITNSEYKVVVCRGIIRLWEVCNKNGLIKMYEYRGVISAKQLEMYEYVKELKVKSKWNLEYWIGGKRQETIMRDKPYGLLTSKKNELMRSTHRSGLLMIVRAEM